MTIQFIFQLQYKKNKSIEIVDPETDSISDSWEKEKDKISREGESEPTSGILTTFYPNVNHNHQLRMLAMIVVI